MGQAGRGWLGALVVGLMIEVTGGGSSYYYHYGQPCVGERKGGLNGTVRVVICSYDLMFTILWPISNSFD